MKRILLLLTAIIFWVNGFSQITFQKTFGRPGDGDGWAVLQTVDGGYMITGIDSSGSGHAGIYLIKLDMNGDTVWTKIYFGMTNDEGHSIYPTHDGGYIIGGSTWDNFQFTGGYLLMKTDSTGTVLWAKAYGGGSTEQGFSGIQTADGGYIMTGSSNSQPLTSGGDDIYVVKTDSIGNISWTKTYGQTATSTEWGCTIRQTTDGGYIIRGNRGKILLIRTDNNGNILWNKFIGGQSFGYAYRGNAEQTSDGGYIVAGVSASGLLGNSDLSLIKINSMGNTLWAKHIGGAATDYGNFVQPTSDGGFIVTGYTYSFGAGGADVYLVKTDSLGIILWSKTFGGTGNEQGVMVKQTSDNGYIIIGSTDSFGAGGRDIYLIKTDSLGNVGCNTGNASTMVMPHSFADSSLALVVLSGGTSSIHNTTLNNKVITTFSCPFITDIKEERPTAEVFFLSPNPAMSELRIENAELKIKEIEIYSSLGEKVFSSHRLSFITHHSVNISQLRPGVYFVAVTDDKGNKITRKFIKM